MSDLSIVLITIVVTLGAAMVGYFVYQSKKQGTEIPWDKIRPIISEVFVEAVKIMEAEKLGYQALEDYSVDYVKRKIDETTILTQKEKDLFTKEFIRSIIAPGLKEIYYKEEKTE